MVLVSPIRLGRGPFLSLGRLRNTIAILAGMGLRHEVQSRP